jgi:hypothetical protein
MFRMMQQVAGCRKGVQSLFFKPVTLKMWSDIRIRWRQTQTTRKRKTDIQARIPRILAFL